MRVELKSLLAAFFVSFLFTASLFPQPPHADFDTLSINNLKLWVSNYGTFAYNPKTGGGGLFYSADTSIQSLIMSYDNIYWTGNQNGSLNIHRTGLGTAPGPMGSFGEESSDKYRVFKLRSDWETLPSSPLKDDYQRDYDEWPGDLGAPYFEINENGKYDKGIDLPQIWGDEMLWTVFHDMEYTATQYFSGMEWQSTVYGFKNRNLLYDVIFKKYRIINKGSSPMDSMMITQYCDPDIGDASNDYLGCDSSLSLVYGYNDTNYDIWFGYAPPAVGYLLLKGPEVNGRDIGLHSFAIHSKDWENSQYQWGENSTLNLIHGKFWNGGPYVNPHTQQITRFPLSGDPYRQTGWYEGTGWPQRPYSGDRRFYLSSGPFYMAPGDTQEVVYAILAARGNSNVHSVELLKNMVSRVKLFYEAYSPKAPEIKEEPAPLYYNLAQNFPNPFNAQTTINYQIPLDSRVTIKVYDILGNEAAVLKDEFQSAGRYRITFDAGSLASGIYFLNISAREFFSTKKMILLR